ncbi:hypothetical protein PB2503_05212 [Parvularcula bermudensis HTCC2503]|uniref:AB hydrolase-1 domain-containing protein n=1 Tax=Parvularcula bermudensis (strain ATCC BAA-594 / HTCC2503 / KCTC 12087) TaxID=314260 RepID=E0TFV2_PARBH|nr:alpha/beta fold hydrolase [Parvularcula bermudensis]ADM09117.1 hypothetical protein PB2503_05212 [Parvularcula bermudensis HTCC2503]
MQRQDITFNSGGDQCAAWLYLPDGAGEAPPPVIVMAHGLGGVRSMRLDAFAERYCAAGYACFVFDYRYFGDSDGAPRQLLRVSHQLEDWENAVAAARACHGVDPERVVLWGTSFSGGHVLALGARLKGIAAVMSQCPFTDGISSSLALPPLSSLGVSLAVIKDFLVRPFGHRGYVSLVGLPGSAALIAAPGALAGYEALKPEGAEIETRVAAEIGLMIGVYRPRRYMAKIPYPTLVVVCLEDQLAPAGPTLAGAKSLPKGEVVTFETDHFDIYIGEWFERTVAVQLDFLARHVPLGG